MINNNYSMSSFFLDWMDFRSWEWPIACAVGFYWPASRAALTIGLGGAEAPGPEQGGGPWLAVE